MKGERRESRHDPTTTFQKMESPRPGGEVAG